MKYHLMTDAQIMEDLGKQFEQLRLFKNLTVDQVCEQGGTNKLTVNRFTHNKNAIRLDGLISILRGVGELDKLEALFELPESQKVGRGRPKKCGTKIESVATIICLGQYRSYCAHE